MTSQVAEQHAFLQDLALLINFAVSKGFQVTAGELWRTPEMQAIYVKQGKSQTSNSLHLVRRAIDLNFFKDGKFLQDARQWEEVGKFWESLNPKNRWGGSWRGLIQAGKSKFIDGPHFERADS